MSKFPSIPPDLYVTLLQRAVDLGSPFGRIDLHHCILSKRDVMGMPDSEKVKIHVPWNILRVNHEYHLNRPVPEHSEAAELMYKLYGRDVVRQWFYGIAWRNKPPFELP